MSTSKHIKLEKTPIILTSALSKAIGLMFSSSIDTTHIFTFNKLKTVNFHTLFVFFPIDMLFLDENKRVLDIKKNIKPFTFNVKSKAKYVVELPTEYLKVKIGDVIDF